MLSRAERIKLLIEESGMSYMELEKVTGIKKSSLQRYATGRTTKIPLDVIENLAKVFDVSQEYIMGWTEDRGVYTKEKPSHSELALTEGEKSLIELFRLIPEEKQRAFLEMGRLYANSLRKD
jgi:transcriptional regulator with XRE-family HTH domain